LVCNPRLMPQKKIPRLISGVGIIKDAFSIDGYLNLI
jgi:hypothetical protein